MASKEEVIKVIKFRGPRYFITEYFFLLLRSVYFDFIQYKVQIKFFVSNKLLQKGN